MKKTLLKLTVACALALAMAPSAQAQLLANDPFLTGGSNYTAGIDVVPQNPTVLGFSGAWFSENGGGTTVSSTPFSYSGTTGYNTTPGAGFMQNLNQNVRTARSFDSGLASAFAAASGTIYMSFELKLANAGAGSEYQAFELNNSGGDGSRFLQLGFSGATGDFTNNTNFGINVGGVKGALAVADTSAHLFVFKLNISGGGDSLQAWEDPTSITGTDPTGGTTTGLLTGFTMPNVPTLMTLSDFIGNGQGSPAISEIRAGGTLGDIAAVPEVPTSSLTLLGLGALVVVMVRRNKLASQI